MRQRRTGRLGTKIRETLGSMHLRIFLLLFAFGMIPCTVIRYGMVSYYRSTALSVRQDEVTTQLRALATDLAGADYFHDTTSVQLRSELQDFSNFYDGRVLVINDQLEVISDTYDMARGKLIVSEDVVNCLRGDSTSPEAQVNLRGGFLEIVMPVVSDEGKTLGVVLASVSTASISSVLEAIDFRGGLMEIIAGVICFALALLLTPLIMRPFRRVYDQMCAVRDEYSTSPLQESSCTETRQFTQAFNAIQSRFNALNESRQEFVSNVSHELKTPMTSMKVLADALLAEKDAPVGMYRDFMEDINSEIDRENRIISELLTLVKTDRREVSLNVTKVDVGEMMEKIMKRVRPIARERNIGMTLICEREVMAEIDEDKCIMAITNLVENAVKYNRDDGKVVVTVDADHKDFQIKVADNGVGIPDDAKERVFDRFYRVDKSRSREVGGTGLGLSITRSMIVLHHGKIEVSDNEGGGTVFTVTIPLSYIPETVQLHGKDTRRGHRGRILWMNDRSFHHLSESQGVKSAAKQAAGGAKEKAAGESSRAGAAKGPEEKEKAKTRERSGKRRGRS